MRASKCMVRLDVARELGRLSKGKEMMMVETMLLGQEEKEVDIFKSILEAGVKSTVFEAVGTHDL